MAPNPPRPGAPAAAGGVSDEPHPCDEATGPGDADEAWMREALAEARAAAGHGDVPVGAILVGSAPGEEAAGAPVILGRGHNRREADGDPTAHAEILAIRAAAGVLRRWRLVDTALYVTQEPCPMCAGALVNARVRRLVYGCDNPKAGAVRTLYRLVEDPRLNHRVEVTPGVLAAECGGLLTEFFRRLRAGPADVP